MSSAITQQKFVIKDFDTLKVVADPLRGQILEVLMAGAHTVRQVADKLGLAPSKLYYHFGLLEKAGLIAVADTRLVANMVERQYRATATEIEVERGLLNFSSHQAQEGLQTYLASTLDTTREDIVRSLEARDLALTQGAEPRPRHVTLSRTVVRIPDEAADVFHKRLEALINEFASADLDDQPGTQGQGQHYVLTVAFYPSFYFAGEPGAEQA